MMWLFRGGVTLLIYTCLNIYTGWRLLAFARLFLPSFKAYVFWPLYTLISHGFIALSVLRLMRPRFVFQAEMYWFPFFVYLLLFLLVFDLAGLAASLASRGKLHIMPAGVVAALCLSLIMLVYGSFHARNINTVHYELAFPEKPGMENFRIVLVSDMHIGATVGKAWLARIVDRINDASPDMVCIAGDIFDGGLERVVDTAGIAAELRRITAPLGLYACLGNHDVDRSTRSTGGIIRFLKETGITPLADEIVPTVKSGVYVAGRRDARPIGMEGRRLSIKDLTAVIESTASKASVNLVILLDHQPIDLPHAAEAGIDLVLCGHTHRGQFFPGNLITRRIFMGYGGTDYGYWQNGTTRAVISSGAGVWGPPLRIGTNSEIVVLELRF
jgi:predicted MPP superfamily phosphohydrolase